MSYLLFYIVCELTKNAYTPMKNSLNFCAQNALSVGVGVGECTVRRSLYCMSEKMIKIMTPKVGKSQ